MAEDPEVSEISGEFGDNFSLSSRTRTPVAEVTIKEDLPPEDDSPDGCLERIKPMKMRHMKALIWKNFSSLFRNYG